jgi:O-antigen/teichoic acid export membrane protein
VLGIDQVKQGETAELEASRALRSRRVSVARNSIWNFAGQIAPLFLGVFAIPILIHRLGTDRYGVLTLAWVLVGYFSLFDLGIGRAITKLLAEKIALEDSVSAARLIGTAIFTMLLLGTLFGGVLFALAPWLTTSVLKIPPALRAETLRSLPLLAIAVPFVTVTCGLRGMLEAQQNFAAVNALRAGLGAATYLGPLVVLPFSHSLFPVVVTLAAARVIGCGLHYWVCHRYIPVFSQSKGLDRHALRALLGFGSWYTISNLSSPIMVYLDRFVIGSLLSMSAVAYYATPLDAVTKLWVIPVAFAGVLFPAFSEALATGNRERTNSLYERGIGSILAIVFPSVLVIVLFAPEGLRLWLGANFAVRSAVIMRILAIGVFTNSLANMPYALLQAAGRPDLTAKIHMVEVPCYLALLYWGIWARGLEGAAIAWTVRLSVEAAVLFFMAKDALAPRLWVTMAAGTATLLVACGITELVFKILFLIVVLSVFTGVIWRWTLDDLLRLRVRSWLRVMPVQDKASA